MANFNTKARIVYEANTAQAVKAQARLRAEVLAGTKTVKQAAKEYRAWQKVINDNKRVFNVGTGAVSQFTKKVALANLAAMAAAKAFDLMKDAVKGTAKELYKMTKVAAQIEELGTVYRFVGKNAGYSAIQLKQFNMQLRQSGIRQDVANQSLLRAIQANISLEKAVKFARIGQDAATVGLMESSEAYQRIIESVAKLYPRLLKEIGIIINLNVEYARYAKAHKLNVNQLTEAQKKQAMMNAIMEKGARLSGAYETAMTKVSKRMRSIPRWFMDAQQAIGRHFVPALKSAVGVIEWFLKGVTTTFESSDQALQKIIGQKVKFDAHSKDVKKLTTRYVELRKNTERTAEEHEELEDIFKDLRRMFPGALKDWSDYNDVLGINVTKINEITESRKKALQAQLRWSIIKQSEDFKDNTKALAELAKMHEEVEKNGASLVDLFEDMSKAALKVIGIDLGAIRTKESMMEALAGLNAKNEDYIDTMVQYVLATGDIAFIEKVHNKTLRDKIKALVAAEEAIDNTTNAETAASLAAAKRIQQLKDFIKLRKQITGFVVEARFESSTVGFTKYEEDRAKIEEKYRKIRHDLEKSANEENAEMVKDALLTAERAKHQELDTLRRDHDIEVADEEEEKAKKDAAKKAAYVVKSYKAQHKLFKDKWNPVFKAATNIIHDFGSGLASAVVDGKSFKEIIKSIFKQLIRTAIQLGVELLAVKALSKAYEELAKKKAAAAAASLVPGVGGIAGVLGIVGAAKGLLPFDDPVNDAILRRENRRIARISSEGIAQGYNEVANRRMSNASLPSSGDVSMGDINIIIQGNADESTVGKIREFMRTEFSQMVKDGEIAGFTSERYHGR